jgi:hypothetical protein
MALTRPLRQCSGSGPLIRKGRASFGTASSPLRSDLLYLFENKSVSAAHALPITARTSQKKEEIAAQNKMRMTEF